MTEVPPLPQRVSSDGHELWDWAGDLSRAIQRADAIAQAKHDLAEVQRRRCGSCSKWMTNHCKYETLVKGHKQGPSCSGAPCGGFERSGLSLRIIEQRRAALAALDEEVEGDGKAQ